MAGESKALVWDQDSERLYETGISEVALYVKSEGSIPYPKGVAWNGVTAVNESPSGAEPTKLYANNAKYAELMSAEEFAATIEAYMYPDEFAACNGEAALAKGVSIGQQTRKAFGLCYKTIVGNDVKGNNYAYKLHLVYGCLAKPSARNHATINESPEAETMSWEISSTPVTVSKGITTSTIVIDSREADATKLAALEKVLYGDTADPYLPLPAEVKSMMEVTTSGGQS